MGKYDNQLESLFTDWIKASKKDEYYERRDINDNIIFTYDGLMYKPDLSIREFGIRKGLKKLVISSKIRIFIGENQ